MSGGIVWLGEVDCIIGYVDYLYFIVVGIVCWDNGIDGYYWFFYVWNCEVKYVGVGFVFVYW